MFKLVRMSRLNPVTESTRRKPPQLLLAAFLISFVFVISLAIGSAATAQQGPGAGNPANPAQSQGADRAIDVFTEDEQAEIDSQIRVEEAEAAMEAPTTPARSQGPVYRITGFQLEYLEEPTGAPPISEVAAMVVTVDLLGNVYVGPGKGEVPVSFPLDQMPIDGPTRFDASAIIAIDQQLVEKFAEHGMGGMIVAPAVEDIAFMTGEDIRPPERSTLTITVFLPTIRELQTFAQGDRIPEEDAANNPVHARILEKSPVQPGDAFKPKEVDDYVHLLNRHPGRRVSGQLSPSRDQRQLYLDYSVTEAKPWLIYGQVANNGAESTGKWQLGTGFVNLQTTDNDDILSLDYVGSTTQDLHSIYTGYDRPIYWNELRGGITGSYSKFSADQSFGFLSEFDGQSAIGGMQFSYAALQHGPLFLDAVAGLNYQWVESINLTSGGGSSATQEGSDDFVMPRVGLNLARKTDAWTFFLATWSDMSTLNHDTSLGGGGMGDLGTTNPSDDFYLLRWDWFTSIYLDHYITPLITGEENPITPMAHEFYVSFKGQSAWDKYRLIPYHKYIIGGLDTVRGYEQAILAGDSGYTARAEYRLHIPRLFKPNPEPAELPVLGEFAVAPRQLGGRPDWDLVFKVFYDAGQVWTTDPDPSIESNDFIQSAGVGMDLLLKRWLTVRVDWAWGFEGARCNLGSSTICEIPKDQNEVHFVLNLIY